MTFKGFPEVAKAVRAVAGDYYFDTESGELHKTTGV